MAHPRQQEVRERYHLCCGYCGVSETETGGELTVDHFRPVTAGGDESDDNLVYACFRCNTYKGDFFPNSADINLGHRVLHPLLDPISLHVREDEQTGRLDGLTATGSFHLVLLHLNRPQLVERRLEQGLRRLLSETYRMLQNENETLRVRIVLLEIYLREINHRRTEATGPEEQETP